MALQVCLGPPEGSSQAPAADTLAACSRGVLLRYGCPLPGPVRRWGHIPGLWTVHAMRCCPMLACGQGAKVEARPVQAICARSGALQSNAGGTCRVPASGGGCITAQEGGLGGEAGAQCRVRGEARNSTASHASTARPAGAATTSGCAGKARRKQPWKGASRIVHLSWLTPKPAAPNAPRGTQLALL